MRLMWNLSGLAMYMACVTAVAVESIDSPPSKEPIDLMGMGNIIGSGLQGNGTVSAPLDLKAGTTNGQKPVWNGTQYVVTPDYADPSKRAGWTEDFDVLATNCTTVGRYFVGAALGAGAGCSATSSAGHPGILTIATGTTATGGARWVTSAAAYGFGGNAGEQCSHQLVQIPTLSVAGEEFALKIGWGAFTGTVGADPVDGVWVVYDRAIVGSDVWGAKACANAACGAILPFNGTGGTVNTPVVAGNWIRFDVCAASNGGTVAIKTGCPAACTTVGTISANIPLEASGRRVGIGGTFAKKVGITTRVVSIDFQGFDFPFGTAR